MNVGDGVDIKGATDMMITAMKAFNIQAEDALSIVDKYNEIGNNFALSATDIGDAMQRSASVLAASNTSFDESIALITAGNEILQDPEKTGTALRTIALRIRGAKSELEEMGEETDYVVHSTSKLRELIKGYTSIGGKYEGFDIMEDENTFKSLADIIKGIGKVYGEMSDIDRTAMLEKLAGKNRSNALAAMLQNYKQIDNVLQSIEESEGSALEENAHIVDSIQGRITILQTSAENFWQSFIETDTVKSAVTLLTDLLNALTKIIDTVGTMPIVLGSVGAVWGHQVGLIRNYITAIRDLTAAQAALTAAQKAFDDEAATGAVDSLTRANLERAEQSVNGARANVTANNPLVRMVKGYLALPMAAKIAIPALTAIGITLGIVISKQSEHIKKTREMAEEYAKSSKELKGYEEKIKQLHEVIDDENSTTAQVIEAKEQLNEINNELMDSYGNLKGSIDLANMSLEESLKLTERLNQTKLNEVLSNAQSKTWGISRAVADGFNISKDIIGFASPFDSEYEAAINFMSNGINYRSGREIQLNAGESIKRADLLEELGDFNNIYQQRDAILRDIEKQSNIITNELSSDKEIKQAQKRLTLLNKIKDDYEKAFKDYENIGVAYGSRLLNGKYAIGFSDFQEAQTKYILDKTDENKEAVRESIRELWTGAADEDKAAIEAYFKMMHPDLGQFSNWRFEDWLDKEQYINTYRLAGNDDNGYHSQVDNTYKSARDFLKNIGANATNELMEGDWLKAANLSPEAFEKFLISNHFDKATEDALADFRNFAQNNSEFDVQQLVDIIHEAGYAKTINEKEVEEAIEKSRIQSIEQYGTNFAAAFDELNIKTKEEVSKWDEIREKTDDATAAVEMYRIAMSGIGGTVSASRVLKDMEEQYKPVFDSMAKAYKAIWTDKNTFNGTKNLTSEQIQEVNAQIDSLNDKLKEVGGEGIDSDQINEFILTLADANATATELQDQFNGIATSLVDSLNPSLGAASGETAKLIQKTLTEMGVVNAEEVTMSRLGYTFETYEKAKEEAANIGFDLDDDIAQLDEEYLELIVNNEALMDYYNGRILAMADHIETSEDVRALLKLCSALKITKLGLIDVAETEKKLNEADDLEKAARALGAGSASYNNMMERATKLRDEAQTAISEVDWRAEVNAIWDGNKVKDSSTSDKGKDTKQKFDWIERAIKKIQRAVTNLGKVADATYKTWGERLDAIIGKTEEFHDEIGQFGRGNIDLYNRPVYRTIDENGDEWTETTFSHVEEDEYGRWVLVPRIARDDRGNAYEMSEQEAWDHYYDTGEYLGIFDTIEEANEYAEKLHLQQEAIYDDYDNFTSGKYQKLKEEIALQEQASQAYMAEARAIGLSAEYVNKIQNGKMDIETVTDEKLKEAISDYQELYLNMQPYLMMVWKIILIAGNP